MNLGPPLHCIRNQELCSKNFKSSRQKKCETFFNIFYTTLEEIVCQYLIKTKLNYHK